MAAPPAVARPPPWLRWPGDAVTPRTGCGSSASTNSEGQRIVQEFDTSDEDAFPGRHRSPGSPVRRMSKRLGIAALSILAATELGAGSADLLGVSDPGQVASEGRLTQGIPPARAEQARRRP